jgi:hypothetical protein
VFAVASIEEPPATTTEAAELLQGQQLLALTTGSRASAQLIQEAEEATFVQGRASSHHPIPFPSPHAARRIIRVLHILWRVWILKV